MVRAFTGATVIDGTGADPITRGTVVVDAGRITTVGPSDAVSVPGGAEVVDAAGLFLLPGLFDCHVHLSGRRTMDARLEAWVGPGLAAARAAGDVQKALQAGFTTLRDCGGATALALRDAINEGSLPGPRIIAAGPFVESTGGADDLSFMPLDVTRKGSSVVLVDGPQECRRGVREALRAGADFIKTCNNGGSFLHEHALIDRPEWSTEELATIADEAHRKGVRLAVHAHVAPSIKEAILAGADSIEHCTLLDEECASLMKERGVFLDPTFMAVHRMAKLGADLGTPEFAIKQAQTLVAGNYAAFRYAVEAGVEVILGTDISGFPAGKLGEHAIEFEHLVEAGLTPMQAIQAATRNAARACGLGGSLGTLEAGTIADMVFVAADPLADVRVLQDVRMVVQGGRVVVERRGTG